MAQSPGNPRLHGTLGILLYRTGNYEEAVKQLAEAIASADKNAANTSTTYPRFFLAMTKQKLGDKAEAKRLLAEAQAAMDEEMRTAPDWNRRVTLEVFRREAEAELSESNAGSSANPLK